MPIQISESIMEDHVLVRSDKKFENTGAATVITIRKATQGDCEARNRLYALVAKEYSDNGETIRFTSNISVDDVNRKEMYLCLAACNLVGANEKPLFKFKNNRIDGDDNYFMKQWGQLPEYIANEMIECNKKTNIQWSAEGNASSEID